MTAIPPRIPGDVALRTLEVELAKVEELIGMAVSQFGWKGSVVVATTANITLSGEQTIDGIAVVSGDKVLVKNQTSGVDNGIYVVSVNSWTRAEVMAVGSSASGAAVYVTEGTANGGKIFICTNLVGADVVGTDALVFVSIGTGNVVGPASSTDNALVRFDGTTGKLVQNSAAILDDSGNMTSVNSLTTTSFISAGTTLVAGTGITSTTGNIVATAGNVVAGSSGNQGTVSAFPAGALAGSLVLSAIGNTGNTNVTISNAIHGQATVYSIPDIGASTGDIVVAPTSTKMKSVAQAVVAGGAATQSVTDAFCLSTSMVVAVYNDTTNACVIRKVTAGNGSFVVTTDVDPGASHLNYIITNA